MFMFCFFKFLGNLRCFDDHGGFDGNVKNSSINLAMLY